MIDGENVKRDFVPGTAPPTTGTVTGLVWNDLDGDGIRDGGEAGLANRTVFVDTNGNQSLDLSEISATTDSSGNYTLRNVPSGAHDVVQVVAAGFSETAAPGSVTVTAGSTTSGIDFGNQQQARIVEFSGKTNLSYVDSNGDTVSIRFSGNGSGELHLPAGPTGDAETLIITGSDTRTSIKISARGGDGFTQIENVQTDGDLRAFDGRNVIVDGDLTFGGNVSKFRVFATTDDAEISAGFITKFDVMSTLRGSVDVAGITKLGARGDILDATIHSDGTISKVSVNGTVRDSTITAANFGKASIKGSLLDSLFLAGADLGADGELGGTGVNADTFAAGRIDGLTVKGAMANSLVGAGANPVDSDFGDGNDAAITGSQIRKLAVKGGVSNDSFFISDLYPTKLKFGREKIDPSLDLRFI